MAGGFEIGLLTLGLSLALDVLLGEPPAPLHPTVWMGKFASFFKFKFRSPNPRLERVRGALIWLGCFLVFVPPIHLLTSFLKGVDFILHILVAAFFLKSTFAIKSWESHVKPLIDALAAGRLVQARRLVGKVVGRDTRNLTEEQVISAAVESIAEGIVDGVTSPLFYFALFGLPGALTFRLANTMDSMVGYKDEKHVNVGWFSAKLDTLLNFLPARLTGPLILAASWLLRKDWRLAKRVLLRDWRKPSSLNSGWPMAAVAGALKVRLEKPGHYVLGEELPPPKLNDIPAALRLLGLTSLLFILLVAIPLAFLSSLLIWK